MTEVVQNSNVVEVTNQTGYLENLEALQQRLSVCEKALAEYLETKRLTFPRFYFVSASDLLEIVSRGTQPQQVRVCCMIFFFFFFFFLQRITRKITAWVVFLFPGDSPFAEAIWQHSRSSLQGLRQKLQGGGWGGSCYRDVQPRRRVRVFLWALCL